MLRFVKILARMKNNITQTAQISMGEKPDTKAKALTVRGAHIRIPTQRPIPQLDHHIKRETQQVTHEWSEEVAHTNRVSSHLPVSRPATKEFVQRRIERFHQKKTINLLKKMAELHESTSRKKVSITREKSAQQKLENDSDELWRDMIKPHEERQFQIGRIANFFT